MAIKPAKQLPGKLAGSVLIAKGQSLFQCDKGHYFGETIANWKRGRGCPVCRGLRVFPGQNDLQTTHPEIATQWDYKKNEKSPAEVTAGQKIKAWWICDKGHSWLALINNRKKTGCPICADRLTIHGVNDVSIRNPKLAAEYDQAKNSRPISEIRENSGLSVWWVCELGHSWKQSPRVRSRGRGCPYCSNQRVLPGFNDLQSKHPLVAAWWDRENNNGLSASDVLPGSKKIAFWRCPAGHSFSDSIDARTQAQGCPICLNRRLLVGFNDLRVKRPDLAAEWNFERNSCGPEDVIFSTKSRFWWLCELGHSWRVDPQSRLSGTGCPTCSVTGYKPHLPGRLYFLANDLLESRKIGITNQKTRVSRIRQFNRRGWQEIFFLEDSDGSVIQLVEQEAKLWLRNDLGLGSGVSKSQLEGMSGYTETFPASSVTDADVIRTLKRLYKQAKTKGDEAVGS